MNIHLSNSDTVGVCCLSSKCEVDILENLLTICNAIINHRSAPTNVIIRVINNSKNNLFVVKENSGM